jgi:UDP-glucose 4-epimerase
MSKLLITGGAGFIGSHLVDALMERKSQEDEIVIIDNLSRGSLKNLHKWIGHPKFSFIKGDLKNFEDVLNAVKDCEVIFHLAANPEVRIGALDPTIDFRENILTTYNLLEAIREDGSCKWLLFTSTSTVYGEASILPTPENYAPLKPISPYGASKLACEALISSYAHLFGFKAVILRLANMVGPRSNHGVIYDFITKLMKNPKVLEVLGDGKQSKSYLYINDCIEAILTVFEKIRNKKMVNDVEFFNVGSEDKVSVLEIAKIVTTEMKLKNTKVKILGGVEGRGWKGDVKEMLLDISKLKSWGWHPKLNSAEAVRLTVKKLLGH